MSTEKKKDVTRKRYLDWMSHLIKILQEMIEARLEKRKRTLLGPPIGKTMIYFVDDVNMPKLDTYGSQPPIELLRY